MSEALIPPSFLFQLSTTCRHCGNVESPGEMELGPEHVIPSFAAELNDAPRFADLRMGWHETGLVIDLRTTGKKQSPWCRDSRVEDSDGLSLWVDTRNTHNIHRASQFCHRFTFLPQGAGRLMDQPVARLVPIHRARENPKPAPEGSLKIHSEKRIDGYVIRAFIDAQAMTGYDPDEHIRLGFSYAVTDRELGWQTFSLGPEFPFTADPSLWGTLELDR